MAAVRECGVCWYVYDPQAGDDVWQVPPGTAFDALPPEWRCPRCDSPKDRFLPPRDEVKETRPATLEAVYRDIERTKMKDVPILNAALSVEAVDFQPFAGGLLGALVTPWSVNVVFFPPKGPPAPAMGRARALPAGVVTFLPQTLPGLGEVELLSLFSPALEFVDQAAAVACAKECLTLLLAPPKEEQPVPSQPSRRELFGFLRP